MTVSTVSEAADCDPSLPVPEGNPLAYADRGDRCEGLYHRPVSGAPFHIVSFVLGEIDYALASDQSISIDWIRPTRAGATLQIRAEALTRRVYYRMDTEQPTSAERYLWKTDFLAALSIAKDQLGLVAFAGLDSAGGSKKLYLPVMVRSTENKTPAANISLVILPSMQVSDVYLTLVPQSGDASLPARELALGRGFYPAGRPIPIKLPTDLAAGLHSLEVAAVLADGGAWVETILAQIPETFK